jgi:hypothetical protein
MGHKGGLRDKADVEAHLNKLVAAAERQVREWAQRRAGAGATGADAAVPELSCLRTAVSFRVAGVDLVTRRSALIAILGTCIPQISSWDM